MKKLTKNSVRILIIFCLSLFYFGQTAVASDKCSDDQYQIHPELLKMAFDKVAQKHLNDAGRAALLKLYRSGISTGKTPVNQLLKKLPNVLVAIEAAEAVYAQDYQKLATMSLPIVAEQGLTALGVPLAGPILATVQIVKLSYDDLHHQECLLNIDLAYYNFLDDKKLHTGDKKTRVNYYLHEYIHGEGRDPSNHSRDINRKYLQCYIDKDMPGQHIQVDFPEWNPFGRFNQAIQVSANSSGLKTAAHLMLSDFNNKREIELARKKIAQYRQRTDYKVLKETLPILGNYPLLQEWICKEYLALVKEKGNDTDTIVDSARLNESIVIVIDASGSMSSQNRIEKARNAARAVLRGITAGGDTEVGLITFSGCGNVKIVAEFTTDAQKIIGILPNIRPSGSTPLAKATAVAKKYLREKSRGTKKRLILLTDGKESCSGDPVAEMRK